MTVDKPPKRLLDIVIPSYNRPKRLFSLLSTCLKLRMGGVYFVVIDDGSDLIEDIDDVGLCTTQQVCEYFNHSAIIYLRNPQNIGLAATWVRYYEFYCDAKYTLSVVDKDLLINKQPILNAIKKLEQDSSLCMVIFPILEKDRSNENKLFGFEYTKMSGKKFISQFIRDPNLQHCTSYAIKRVSSMREAGVPQNLFLKDQGLDDAFGIDIDMALRLASVGNVEFEIKAPVISIRIDGATERFPLTFAYTYYQYAKHAINLLKSQKIICRADAKYYLSTWLLLILRGLIVSYRPVHDTERELGTERIAQHLKMSIHTYLIFELIKHKIIPSREMRKLFTLSKQLAKDAPIKNILQTLRGKWKAMKCLTMIKAKIAKYLVYITGRTALDNAPSIAINEGLPSALIYLHRTYRFYKPAAARFWIFLYQYLIQLDSDNSLKNLKPGSFIVHFCCWGKNYSNKAIHYLLPSLNTPGNLQHIVKSREVLILIHCDKAGKKLLSKSPVVKNLQKEMRVVFLVLPQPLLNACNASCNYPNISYFKKINKIHSNNKYFLLGGIQTQAFKTALQNQAHISFMMPDFLLSDSFLQHAFSKIENRTMVATTTFRTNFSNVKKRIEALYHKPSTTLSISARTLTQLQIEHIHDAAKRRVVSESTTNFVPTPQLIFEDPHGFVIRAFHYHPILINCSKIDKNIRFDYMAIDYLVLNQILKHDLSFEQQLWVCDNASEMAVMELSEEDVESYFNVNPSLNYFELLNQISSMITREPNVYNTPLNRYFVSIRHQITSEKIYLGAKEYINDILFFQALDNPNNSCK